MKQGIFEKEIFIQSEVKKYSNASRSFWKSNDSYDKVTVILI